MERTDFEAWNGREVARLLALVENQRRYYQDMVATLPVGLVVLSANRTLVSANRAFRQMLGLRIEDMRGKAIEQILPSDRLIEKIREMRVEGIPQRGFMLQQGGKLLRVAILPLRSWDQEMEPETLLMVDDVSEVPSGTAAVAEASGVVRSPAVASASSAVAVLWRADASQLQFTDVGGGVEQLLGYPASHWLKSPAFFAQRIHKEDREAVLALYQTAIQHNREVTAEFRATTASGETIWCRETVLQAEPGVLTGVLTAIGQRKELEQLRINAERNSALHSLSARLAHDLNNPLMIISGYAEEMLNPLEANDPRRAEIEQILAATERISSLTAQLLEFTRKQASPAERVELAALISGLGGKVEARAAKQVWAMANQEQLEEILPVLVSIMKEDRSPVVVTCDTAAITEHIEGASLSPATYARVTVAASGFVMETEKRKVIFESFLHKTSGRSMGAALARAYAVVREWGGELGFESEAPRGSIFTMYLPLAEPEAEPKTEPTTGAPRPAGTQRETILVVDDEAGIRSLIAKILRREHYSVLEAGTATEAIAIAATHGGAIQLLVTDVMLPDRNGRQLAEKLVQALPKLKVMYISGFTDDESVRAGAFPPGARFLQKPFTLGALIGMVRETLDQ
jgi:two-component system, cell cycle sensor histidine kinase and response regulator CckA